MCRECKKQGYDFITKNAEPKLEELQSKLLNYCNTNKGVDVFQYFREMVVLNKYVSAFCFYKSCLLLRFLKASGKLDSSVDEIKLLQELVSEYTRPMDSQMIADIYNEAMGFKLEEEPKKKQAKKKPVEKVEPKKAPVKKVAAKTKKK